jgi:hypothetical protein
VKRIGFVSDWLSYIVLKGRGLHILVVNVHALSEEKCGELKVEEMFDPFPKYYMKIFLGGFKAKLGREDIFKPIIGLEILHQNSNDNGVRLLNFATLKKIWLIRVRRILTGTFINTPGPPLMARLTTRLTTY